MHGDYFPDLDVVVIDGGAATARCIESILAAYPAASLRIYIPRANGDGDLSASAQVRFLEVKKHTTRAEFCEQGWRAGNAAYVQFVDGRSVLDGRWLGKAVHTLQDDPDLGAVCGRRIQVGRKENLFDLVAEQRWNFPAGNVPACGPEAMIRRNALEEADGFDPRLRSGETLDLSLRMLSQGRSIRLLDAPMTRSDASCGLRQYLRGAYAGGYAFSVLTILHGRRGGYWVECLRILLRGCVAPACVLVGQFAPLTIWTGWVLSLAGLAAFFYPRLFLVEKFMQRMNFSEKQARRFAWHSVLVVLPEFFGLLRAIPHGVAGLLRRKIKGSICKKQL